MRLGELKQKIDSVVDEQGKLFVDSVDKYGGQAHIINNSDILFEVLELVLPLKWNDIDSTEIESVLDTYRPASRGEELNQEEFNKLNNYINSVNNKFPLFYSILYSMVEEQENNAINIKLPDNIATFKDLDTVNNRYEKIFKQLNVDGSFEFRGFDTGTNWYMVVATGILTYRFTIACLKVAQELLRAREIYYKSEEARIHFKASLIETEKNTNTDQKDLDAYLDRWFKIKIEQSVNTILKELNERNGHTEPEMQTKLIVAVKSLVTELGEGTEFHLSLNPPKFAREKAGSITIDYKKIREIQEAENNKLEKKKELPPADNKKEKDKPMESA